MSISRAQSSRIFPARACFQVISVIANVLRRGDPIRISSWGVLPHFPVRQVGNRSNPAELLENMSISGVAAALQNGAESQTAATGARPRARPRVSDAPRRVGLAHIPVGT